MFGPFQIHIIYERNDFYVSNMVRENSHLCVNEKHLKFFFQKVGSYPSQDRLGFVISSPIPCVKQSSLLLNFIFLILDLLDSFVETGVSQTLQQQYNNYMMLKSGSEINAQQWNVEQQYNNIRKQMISNSYQMNTNKCLWFQLIGIGKQ